MNCKLVSEQIVGWLQNYLKAAKAEGFVVGVSGGVDSGLVSTLCAMAGKTVVVQLPINNWNERAYKHAVWLEHSFANVNALEVILDDVFKESVRIFNLLGYAGSNEYTLSKLAEANMKSRLRMVTLYGFANTLNYLVAGTGNKVEDYGVGFFTKYGDGGVDISPIGDLLKTEVRELASYLGVNQDIVNAVPTDGLWEDNRSDESQLGASYADLEKVMNLCQRNNIETLAQYKKDRPIEAYPRDDELAEIYLKRHESSRHKMEMPPICKINR